MRRSLWQLTTLCALTTVSCSDSTAASSVASIVIEPETLVLQTAEATLLHANLFDGSGGSVVGPKVSWTSSASAVVSITKSGKVTAVSEGTSAVVATLNGHTSTLPVTVIPRILSSFLRLTSPTVALGATDQITLILYDAHDNPINATVPTEWGVDDASKAKISASGLLTPIAVGMVYVTARYATGGSLAVNNLSTVVYIVAQTP